MEKVSLKKRFELETGSVPSEYGSSESATEIVDNGKITLDNYPNPFNPTTTISYTLQQKGPVNLVVFNIAGKKVTELVSGVKEKGSHSVNFNASDLSSGIYLYKLQTPGNTITRKMTIIK